MSNRFEVLRACEPLITAALDMALAERKLPAGQSVRNYEDRVAGLIQQVHAVSGLLDELEPGEMPRSWRRPEPQLEAS